MRARWLLPLLLVAACQQKSKPMEAAPDGRATREPFPMAPAPHFAAPPQGVRLPKQWDGYVGVSPDDKALAAGTSTRIWVADVDQVMRAQFQLPADDLKAKEYLVAHHFQPPTTHPPDRWVQVEPRLSYEGNDVVAQLGDQKFKGPVVMAVANEHTPALSVAGWAQDERALVVRLTGGSEVTYALISVTK